MHMQKIKTMLIINTVSVSVNRYFLWDDGKVHHVNIPEKQEINIKGKKCTLPGYIYMVNQDVVAKNKFHKDICEYFKL